MVAETPIWRDRLTAEERAQLGRGAAEISLSRPDVLVVGGGIAGVATPAAPHTGGPGSVLLVEAGRLGAGGPRGGGRGAPPRHPPGGGPPPFFRGRPAPPGGGGGAGGDPPRRARGDRTEL